MNLFESFEDIISKDYIAKLQANSSDNLGDTEVAARGVFYTLVAGLIRRTNSDMSASMLYNQIIEKHKKSSIPEEFMAVFSQPDALSKISEEGSKIISQIFPAYKSPLLSMISSYASTSKNTTVMTSGFTASMLIDMLGKKIKSEKMDKDQLVYFLKQHHELLLQEAPESLMEKMIPALGLQELINTKIVAPKKPEPNTKSIEEPIATKNIVSKYEEEESSDGEFFINKKLLIGIFVALLIGALGYYLWASGTISNLFEKEDTPVETMDEELLFADSLARASKDSLKINSQVDTTKTVPLNNSEINILKTYLADASQKTGKEFDFKSIQYLDKTFDLTNESKATIDSLATIMNQDSKIQIKITAFSEEGDVKLNNKRAFAVKKGLLAKGVNTIRIDAGSGGKGGNFPKIKIVSK